MAVSDYIEAHRKKRVIPKDQFGHADKLLDTEEILDVKDITTFSKLVSRQALLANVDSDELLHMYQEDARILTSLLDMARRDSAFEYPFLVLYSSWMGELGLTRTKDGTERILQANVMGTGYHPREDLGGYGSDMYGQDEEASGSILDNLQNKLGAFRNRNKQRWKTSGKLSSRM